MRAVDSGSSLPRLRPPRSSLAVGRRFRLLARDPLIGAGIRPRIPSGFVAVGRADDANAAPESPHEKFLVLPAPDNTRSRDLAWAEARWVANIAAEDTLLLSMMLPTETAPERKKEAQHLHERALKLFQRVDALGPGGVGDPRSVASDARSALQPVLELFASCRHAQEEGELQGLAWPSLLSAAQDGLAFSLGRLEAVAASEAPLAVDDAILAHAPRVARLLRLTVHMLDPEETAWAARCQDLARRLDGLDGSSEARVGEGLLQEAVQLWTQAVRAVEAGQLRSILTPMVADHLRREAAKALDDLRRARIVADREA